MVINVAQDDAAGDHEGRFVDQVVRVGGQVGVVGEGRGERGRAVAEREVAADCRTLPGDGLWDGGFEGCGAGFWAVGCDEAGDFAVVFVGERGGHFFGRWGQGDGESIQTLHSEPAGELR